MQMQTKNAATALRVLPLPIRLLALLADVPLAPPRPLPAYGDERGLTETLLAQVLLAVAMRWTERGSFAELSR